MADPRRRLLPWPDDRAYLEALKHQAQDLGFFLREIVGFSLLEEEPHGALCRWLMRSVASGRRRRLVLMPRGSFKSSIVTVGYLLWTIARDSSQRNLIDSDLRGNAKKFAGLVRWHLEGNTRFRQLYGELKREPGWTEDGFTCKREMESKEPTVYTSGMDQVVVGLHFDRIVCDDLVNDTNVRTKEQIDATMEHLRLLYPILEIPDISPEAELLMTGTRWDDQDLYGQILRLTGLSDEAIESRLAEGEGEIGDWDIFFRSARHADGKPLFSLFSEEFLTARKIEMGPYNFAAQYENSPMPSKDVLFQREWFRTWEHVPEFTGVYMAVDPAITERVQGDYSAVVIVGATASNDLYVLEAWRARVNPADLIAKIFELYDAYLPTVVGMEQLGFQRMLASAMREEMVRRHLWIPIKELKPQPLESKEGRIKGLIPYYANGAVFHRPGMVELEMELLRFPRRKSHDDLIDAFGYIIQQMLPTRQVEQPIPEYLPDSVLTGYLFPILFAGGVLWKLLAVVAV